MAAIACGIGAVPSQVLLAVCQVKWDSSFVISRAAASEVVCHVCDFAGYAILDDILIGLLTNCLGIPKEPEWNRDLGLMPRVQITKRQKGARLRAKKMDKFRRGIAEAIRTEEQVPARVAIHETAHTVLLWRHPRIVDVFRHTAIVPRPGEYDGVTRFWERRVVYTRPQLKAKLMMVLTGWAAEELYCGVSIGHVGGDVDDAEDIAEMVCGSAGWGDQRRTRLQLALRKNEVIEEYLESTGPGPAQPYCE
uniref:Peptidase_M41 domain-containing protein n=1 Tax=Globodera pallida TaxID=36090 RepID=A0A183BXM8_GLOPA